MRENIMSYLQSFRCKVSAATKTASANPLANPVGKWEYSLIGLLKSGKLLNIIPFHFDTSTNTVTPSPYIPYRLVWLGFLLLYIFDILYMFHISSTVNLDQVSEDEFVNFYVHFITRLVAGVLIVNLSFNTYEISEFSKFLVSMSYKCDIDAIERKGFRYFFQATVIFVHVQPLFPFILHLQSRHSARYWPSQFLEKNIYDSFLVAAGYAILDLNYSFIGIWGSFFNIIPVLCYNYFGQQWMQKLGKKMSDQKLPFRIAVMKYKEQLLMNRIFNHFFSKTLIPLVLTGGLVAIVILFGSVLKSFHRLPLSGILNCVLGCIFVLIASKYILEGGGILIEESSKVKRLLLNQFLDGRSYCNVAGIRVGEQRRVLKCCTDLRMYVLNNEFATQNSFPEFMDVTLVQTVNYVLAL